MKQESLTVKSAALELGLSEQTIRRYVRKRFLIIRQAAPGHAVRILRASVDRMKVQLGRDHG